MLGIMEVVRLASTPTPSFAGKGVREWFEDCALLDSKTYPGSPSQKAFEAMEGDVVPYLINQVNARPSPLDEGYTMLLGWLPKWAQSRLPKPRDSEFYKSRSDRAMERLGEIGMAQRFKAEVGEPSVKPPAALAVPAIRIVLLSTNEWRVRWAAQTIHRIGPAAAAAAPDLIMLVRSSTNSAAMQSLGFMGASASNAVPMLINLAMDDRYENRTLAITALANLGETARPTAPALASLISNTNEDVRQSATIALARTGFTPEEAVPALTAMRQGTNEWAALYATLALWNRNRQDTALRVELATALQTDRRAGLLIALGFLGTNAAGFEPDIAPFVNSSDTWERYYAKRALRKIRPVTP